MSIFVALTVQNTKGVQDVLAVPTEFVISQFQSLIEDFNIRAVKTGMLFDANHVWCVVQQLSQANFGPLVVDPVMIAKGGHALLSDDAIEVIKTELLPLAFIVTPNLPETEVLVGYKVESEEEMIRSAYDIQKLGVTHVIIKGGHSEHKLARDFVLLASGETYWLETPRI